MTQTAQNSPPVTEAAEWLDAHWDPALLTREWWALCYEAGWLFPHWPEGFGGHALSELDTHAVYEAFIERGALGPPFGTGPTYAAPTILLHGAPELQQRFVPALGQGLEAWCQLFSEPGTGSDLASVRTRAQPNGRGGWRVDGQKIWTSGAGSSSRAVLLARTDWSVPKHRGLTLMVIDLDQPGVTIRPIQQMNGTVGAFNEVFLDDVEVPDENVIGGTGEGWRYAQTLLGYERGAMNSRVPGLVYAPPGPGYGQLDVPAGDIVSGGEETTSYVRDRRWISARALADVARSREAMTPAVEQRLVDMLCLERAVELLDQRVRESGGSSSRVGVTPSIIKLVRSDLGREASLLVEEILGADGLLVGDGAPEDGALSTLALSTPSFSISGGTDQIQRNIIAERHFDLPRESDPTRNTPFDKSAPQPG